jgi:hypothetical protein
MHERLAVRRRAETPLRRRDLLLAFRKARAQQRVSGDIGAAIILEGEARRTRCFCFVEKCNELRPFVVSDRRDIDIEYVDGGKRLSKSFDPRQETPSFFCRLVEDVVYWNRSFLSG